MELDHIFLFVKDRREAERYFDEAGLRAEFSRTHPGQGTTNLCAFFEDMYFELIWLDGTEPSEPTKQITLIERGKGLGLPLGISWRGNSATATFPYHAPYLPKEISIPVAQASKNLDLPLVFQTPGGTPPAERAPAIVGDRQLPALTTLNTCIVGLPNSEAVADLLKGFDKINVIESLERFIELRINRSNGGRPWFNRWTF